jgi:phytoene dehydrogenase-like protein
MQPRDQNSDVIVVGGGLAGLAAATLIARGGKSVRLIEQSHAPGGRARTKQQDGFYFNIGPHALYRGGRAIEVLKELGVQPKGALAATSGAFAIKDGVKYTFPAGVLSMLTTSLFGLSSKLETARFLASIGSIDGNEMMGLSVREWVDRHLTHSAARELITAVLRLATYVNDAEHMSAGAAIEQLKLALGKGVLYLDGGWQTLVEGLVHQAEGAGVVFKTGAKVEVVERGPAGAVQGVRLADGTLYKSPCVIIASSPIIAASIVERSEQTSLARWAREATPVKAACLDIGLTRLPRPGATFALGIDRPLYLSVHSAAAQLAPEGGATIHLAKYLKPGEEESPADARRELEALIDLVQPGWRDVVAHQRFMPDLTVMHAMPTAASGGTRGRPGPQVEDVPGLLVIGDWVGKEGLLADAGLASARKASEIVAGCFAASLAATL